MDIDIIGYPVYFGSSFRGVENGPNKLRESGLIEIFKQKSLKVHDKGNIKINSIDKELNKNPHINMRHKEEVFDASKKLSKKVYKSIEKKRLPFVVGGDHSLAIGSIAGVNKALGDDVAIIWIDAHSDINTPKTSPSGNIHGMPLAVSLGIGDHDLININNISPKIKSENIYILGLRSIDPGEKTILNKLNIKAWTSETIHRRGMGAIISELLSDLSSRNIESIHISYDIDSLDKSIVPGTGTPVDSGLFLDESSNLIKAIIKTGLVRSIDFAEYNPELDIDSITLNSIKAILDVFATEISHLNL